MRSRPLPHAPRSIGRVPRLYSLAILCPLQSHHITPRPSWLAIWNVLASPIRASAAIRRSTRSFPARAVRASPRLPRPVMLDARGPSTPSLRARPPTAHRGASVTQQARHLNAFVSSEMPCRFSCDAMLILCDQCPHEKRQETPSRVCHPPRTFSSGDAVRFCVPGVSFGSEQEDLALRWAQSSNHRSNQRRMFTPMYSPWLPTSLFSAGLLCCSLASAKNEKKMIFLFSVVDTMRLICTILRSMEWRR
ncbi:hypothetical protein BV25DRAFT_1637217 [Artomyces pyxidatus]|uniref:Uncharacterized protein n=1 Tax=Artomyces pyxidatus TaxID=48021 RepID=A0ACB8SKA4_9AGAM|nr:hypothetical protein BV25DRAFT_1637217 [Artomyces pyxidatus]